MATAPYWRDHWNKHAGQWEKIGSPLRPCSDDITAFKHAISSAGNNGLMLGATPELAALGNITAIDRNPQMTKLANCKVIQGEWLEMPFANGSFDFAIGDGSFNMLQYTGEYETVFKKLSNIIKPEGRIALRLFAAPETGESIDEVVEAAVRAGIGSFHAFKWRFAMAMVAAGNNRNIKVADIYTEFTRCFPEREKLSRHTAWTIETINTIDVYKDSAVSYSFPKLSEFRQMAQKYFNEIDVEYGNYELAERCPVITYSIQTNA